MMITLLLLSLLHFSLFKCRFVLLLSFSLICIVVVVVVVFGLHLSIGRHFRSDVFAYNKVSY